MVANCLHRKEMFKILYQNIFIVVLRFFPPLRFCFCLAPLGSMRLTKKEVSRRKRLTLRNEQEERRNGDIIHSLINSTQCSFYVRRRHC